MLLLVEESQILVLDVPAEYYNPVFDYIMVVQSDFSLDKCFFICQSEVLVTHTESKSKLLPYFTYIMDQVSSHALFIA